MNKLYERGDELENELKKNQIHYERGNYTNHYIRIDGKDVLQKYYVPVFTIKYKGDIGINIDGFFFEIMKKKSEILLEQIKDIIQKFPNIEIYGYNDCLNYFYKKGDKAEIVFKKITQSKEEIIQFNIQSSLEIHIKELLSIFQSLVMSLSKVK